MSSSQWEQIKLSDLFILQMGKTPFRDNPAYWNGQYNWLSISDLGKSGKYITETKEHITETAVSETGIKLTPKHTIVMSFKLSIGKTAITSEDIYTNEAIMSFIDSGKYPFEIDYIYHLFSGKNWDELTNKAVKGKTLNKATLSEIKIPLPPLAIQQEIATVLNKVTSAIATCHMILEKLDLLVKSRFVEMFGTMPVNEKHWTVGKIRDTVHEVRYGSSRKAAEGRNGKFPYLRMNNITYSGELDLSDTKTIDIPEEELSKCTVKRGDVLFNRTNSKELVGKTCVYNRDELMVLAGFIVRIRVNNRMLPEFLSAFLNTDFSKAMLFGMCKAAIGQANINAQELQNIDIYIPPIELQTQFVEFVQSVDKSKLKVKKLLEKAETLKKSLMQEYFS